MLNLTNYIIYKQYNNGDRDSNDADAYKNVTNNEENVGDMRNKLEYIIHINNISWINQEKVTSTFNLIHRMIYIVNESTIYLFIF